MKTSDIKNLGNAYRSIYEAKIDEKEFKPHMMYDPKTGKGHKAEKPEDHERMKKMGYSHEKIDEIAPLAAVVPAVAGMAGRAAAGAVAKRGVGALGQKVAAKTATTATTAAGDKVVDKITSNDESAKLPRQMLDPKKDVMVVKNNKVIVIDKSKEKEYLKKGWGLAEQVDDIDERMKFGKRLKVGDIVYTADGGKYIKGEITKIIGKHDRDSGTFEVKLKSGKVVKRNLDQMAADADTMEAVSPEQQAAIAISKKEKEEMKNEDVKKEGLVGALGGALLGKKFGLGGAIAGGIAGSAAQDILKKKANEGSVKDLAMKIDRVVAKMNKNSKLKPFAKKFASMAMDSMDIEKSLEKALPSSVSGADMISVLEKKLDPVDDKANDKEFKNRKDKDIDNDGDVDSSDEYLHNRRAKVDDEIDGGKKPAKKEEKEDEVLKKKDKPVAKDMSQPVAKSPKTSEIEKIGESFVAMLEAALKSDGKDKDGEELSKKATDDEKIDEKEPVKGKEFIKKHDASDKDLENKEEESKEVTTKAGSDATKPKSGKRDIDSTTGDTKIVNPVKEGTEETRSLVDMARAHLAGDKVDFSKKVLKKEVKEKNPYDARFKEAKAFMARMDKKRGDC